MINQEHKDTYSLVVINWFREDREYLIPQYSRISACLYSCPSATPPGVTSPICSQERSSYLKQNKTLAIIRERSRYHCNKYLHF